MNVRASGVSLWAWRKWKVGALGKTYSAWMFCLSTVWTCQPLTCMPTHWRAQKHGLPAHCCPPVLTPQRKPQSGCTVSPLKTLAEKIYEHLVWWRVALPETPPPKYWTLQNRLTSKRLEKNLFGAAPSPAEAREEPRANALQRLVNHAVSWPELRPGPRPGQKPGSAHSVQADLASGRLLGLLAH